MMAMDIESYLHKLMVADHLVASLPKSPQRYIFQKAIGRELAHLIIIQQVESAKGPSVESISS